MTLYPLPEFVTSSLANARSFGAFLRASAFPDLMERPLFASELDLPSVLGLYDATSAAEQGLATWLRAQISGLHSSPAFDAYAAECRTQRPELQIPRLRHLVPPQPTAAELRADLFATLCRVLEETVLALPPDASCAEVERILTCYLDRKRFAEALSGASTEEHLAELFQTHMPMLLRLIDHCAAPTQAEGRFRALVGLGCRHFFDMRSFARAYALAQKLAHAPDGATRVDPALLDDLWYGAFRLGRLDEAQSWLAHWAQIRPLQKRPLVYRALVTAATDKAEACRMLELAGAADGRSTIPGNVLYAEYSMQLGHTFAAELALRRACDLAQASGQTVPEDYMVALHNVLTAQGQKTDALRALFQKSDLRLDWDRFGLDSVTDSSPQPDPAGPAQVTVVMTAYNAATYLRRAVEGVLAQNTPGLRLIIVDDCSTDGTADLCTALAADRRVLPLRMAHNVGTYAAKNLGIRHALDLGCDYVALCDSDDFWLRPHVARHLAAMRANEQLQCTTSQWIRVRNDSTVECGLRGRYVETCPHSTFFRAGVFERIGYFDAVRFGADREFLRRLVLHFGPSSVANLPVILTLGRRHDQSLTQAGAGAISEFYDSPLRLSYWQAWNDWHLEELAAGRLPRIEAGARNFPVSTEMLP